MLPQNASPSTHAPSAPVRFTSEQVQSGQAAFIRKVFAIMGAGLAVTGLTALVVVHSPTLLRAIFGHTGVYLLLLLAELGMVILFSRVVRRSSIGAIGAASLFYVYAIMNGLTLSAVFLVYQLGSVANVFFMCAGTFIAVSAYGYATNRDLTSVGSMMLMGLLGLIIAGVINLFLRSPLLYWGISIIGVLVFVGLTAFDVQKLKEMYVIGSSDTEQENKEAIHGALVLYLDFVNLFLYLLRIFGRRR